MRRHLVVTAAVALVALSLSSAQAATRKPAPKRGGYTVTLYPDPTIEATGQVPGMEGCSGVSPQGTDRRTLAIPAKGTLKIVLDSPDPTGAPAVGPLGSVGTDWDLYLRDTDDSIYASSHGGTSHEEITTKFRRAQKITVEVCNLIGQPDGTVKWVFTYA
jgi:hypothetical protein